MLGECTKFIFRITIICQLFISFPLSSSVKVKFTELLGQNVNMPTCCPDTTTFMFVHIVRGQECTKCSVSSLYQWNDVITMIGRKDISYFFIIETLPEDTPDTIVEVLERRAFFQSLFVDYNHEFLENNKWLKKRKYREFNDFVVDRSGKIVKVGDPLNDFHFLRQMVIM